MMTKEKASNDLMLDQSALTEGLVKLNYLLADYHVFYQNLRGLHWNIKGRFFFGLHEKFEELYLEAAQHIDDIAERILTLGGVPLHTLEDFVANAKLTPAKNVETGEKAIAVVLEDSQYFLKHFREILTRAADIGDEGTVDLISNLIALTEKRIWMFSSLLK